jgi:MFS family permease
MMTTMSFPALISKPVWGWLMDIVQPKVLAAIGFVLSGVAMFVILAGANAGSLPVLIGGFLLIGLGFGGQIPLQEVIWASYFGRRYLGAVRSVAMPFALGLGAGGPLIVQLYFDSVGNYDGAFIAIALLWVVAALLVLMVRRPVKPGAPSAPDAPPAPPAAGPPENGGASPQGRPTLASGAAALVDGDGVAAGEPERETVAVPARVPPRDYMAAR